MWKHLEEVSIEKMNGEDSLQKSPEWIEKLSNVFFLDEALLEFLQKMEHTVYPWVMLSHRMLSEDVN